MTNHHGTSKEREEKEKVPTKEAGWGARGKLNGSRSKPQVRLKNKTKPKRPVLKIHPLPQIIVRKRKRELLLLYPLPILAYSFIKGK